MAQTYLRDRTYVGVTVDERLIRELFALISAQAAVAPQALVTPPNAAEGIEYVVIRFDNCGFRVWSVQELLDHYHSADRVERLAFVVESKEAVATQRVRGSYAELRLDAQEGNISHLVVASDDLLWVNNTYNAIFVALQRARNRNPIVRWPIVGHVLQLAGLVLGFLVSLWAAGRMAPSLAIENAFIYCFIFAFVFTSILWSAISSLMMSWLRQIFPQVRFVTTKSHRSKWIVQALLGALIVAILGLAADSTWRWIAGLATGLIRQGT